MSDIIFEAHTRAPHAADTAEAEEQGHRSAATEAAPGDGCGGTHTQCVMCGRGLTPGTEALFCASKQRLICVPCNSRHLYMAQRCILCHARWFEWAEYCPQWVTVSADGPHAVTRDACPCTFGWGSVPPDAL